MTPSPDPDDRAEPLTAEEEHEVSALLADALGRDPVTTPPHVVARLDDVLAGLVAEHASARDPQRDAPGADASVVRLETRRRRWPRVALAAAAVVLGGYAVGNVALNGSLAGDDSGGGSTAQSAADSAGGQAEGASGSAQDQPQAGRENLARLNAPSELPPVRRDKLAADVRRVVREFDQLRAAPESRPDCRIPGDADAERLYPVRYQGAPARLVVGPRRSGQSDVTVYSCRTGGVELSRTVPAPEPP